MADVPVAGSLLVSPAPHIRGAGSSALMTWTVTLCLVPAAAWGVFLFGAPAAFVLLVAVGTALATELAVVLPFRGFTLGDGSAFLTGLIVGLLMPAGAPLHIPAAASAFGIVIVKQSFGGLGRNWMNPALAGVAFAHLSWGGALAKWVAPRGALPGTEALAPLEALRMVLAGHPAVRGSLLRVLADSGYPFSGIDGRVVGWINARLLAPLGGALPRGVFDLLVGNAAGRIGEVSVPLLLAGAAWLIARRIVRWQVPVSFVASFAVLAGVFGGLTEGRGWFAGGVFVQLFSGSLILCAFFAAPDPVTAPLSAAGRYFYGAGLGVAAFFLRFYGSMDDGAPIAVILGNCFVPLIDRLVRSAGSGLGKAGAR